MLSGGVTYFDSFLEFLRAKQAHQLKKSKIKLDIIITTNIAYRFLLSPKHIDDSR